MKESFGDALGNAIVKNLAKNADVDPKKIAVGLVVTVAGTALTAVTKSVTQKIVGNVIRKANDRRLKTESETKDILELDDKSSDEN